jgi:hypothetical protein
MHIGADGWLMNCRERILVLGVLALTAAAEPARAQTAHWVQVQPAGPSPSARSHSAMAYDSQRGVAVLYAGLGAVSNDTWEWNGAWTQRPTIFPAPTPGWDHALAYDSGRGLTVLVGGQNHPNPYAMWEWDSANWRLNSLGGTFTGKAALAYDAARAKLVLVTPEAGLT